MQSRGGPQLVAELPQRFKKKQATRFVATIGSAKQIAVPTYLHATQQRISPRWLAFIDFPAQNRRSQLPPCYARRPSFSRSPAYCGAISPRQSAFALIQAK